MDREHIINFIEKIRPQIKEAGAPESVLLSAARDHNLAPAQLESTAQMLNTAQQLHFMDKSANRGDTFSLIDVPKLVSEFVQHETPEKVATATIDSRAEEWTKAASEIVYEGGIPLSGKRLPDLNAKLLKDAGVEDLELVIIPAEELPRTARSRYRDQQEKAAKVNFEIQGLEQMICDNQDVIRKAAEEVVFRLRTEPDFVWAEAKSDGLFINKEATEKAAPVIEDYLSQLGSVNGFGYRKVAFATEPAPQTSMLVEDRYDIMPCLMKIASAVEMIEELSAYKAHVRKSSSAVAPPPQRPPSNEEEAGIDEEVRSGSSRGQGPPSDAPAREEESGDVEMPEEGMDNPLRSLSEIIMPPEHAGRTAEEKHTALTEGIDSAFSGAHRMLEKVPGPRQVHSDLMAMIEQLKPGKNNKQMQIDNATTDVKTVTNLQRLMLTDPIIRDADPDMVLSLYNTLQNANPEVARDPNLLRFALRESLQYESVPLHTYKDLVDVDDKKQKARETTTKNEDARYTIR